MVVLVATVLATASLQLKPFQEKNIRTEKMQNILQSVKIESTPENAEQLFNNYITGQLVLNDKGEVIGDNSFDIELQGELKKPAEKQQFPLYIATFDNGQKSYIIPVRGKGLWGPIWGFIALEEDMNTIYGTNFDHKSETPGLGAEIKEPPFQDQFIGKRLFDSGGQFKSIVVKKGGADKDNPHAVDGISGGTITSDGVSNMLMNRLNFYVNYLKSQKS